MQTPLKPVNGVVTLADQPGLGMELDQGKIEEQRSLSWAPARWS